MSDSHHSLGEPVAATPLFRESFETKRGHSAGQERISVLLVGNYANDRQQSMQRFAELLSTGLKRRGVDVSLLVPKPKAGRLIRGSDGLGKWLGYIDKLLLFPRELRRAIRVAGSRAATEGKSLVVHICDHSNSFYTRYLGGVPHVVTCHDLLAIRSARSEAGTRPTSWTGRVLQSSIARGIERAQNIVCVSEATSHDVTRLMPGKSEQLEVIHNGLNHPYSPMPAQEAWARIGRVLPELCRGGGDGSKGFLLHVGGNQWYKNRKGVLAIYFELCRALQSANARSIPKLVLVGRRIDPELEELLAGSRPLSENVILKSDLESEDLRALYSVAELLLFPSLEEGFGWPIVEAQSCGCPVVTTRKAPMTEIGGDAAIYLEPEWIRPVENSTWNCAIAAEAVLRVLNENRPEHERRVRAGIHNALRFSSDTMISRYIECYERVAGLSPN